MIIDRFPGIRRIALEIAYDNGMINRYQSQSVWLSSLDEVLGADGVDEADLRVLDEWCLTLSDEDAETLAAGEQTEMEEVAARCPRPDLCGIFNDIFEQRPDLDQR